MDPNQRASFISSAESRRPRGLRRPEEDQLQQTGLPLSCSSLLPGFYHNQPSRRPATGGRFSPLLSEGPPRPSLEGGRGSSPGRFKARHLLAAGPQGRATACLRRHNSSSTLGETIQSVRLAQPLYSSIQALVCLCWQIYSTCVLSCLSPLPHTFGPAAVAVALAELPAAPLFSAVFIHHSRRFRPTRANDFKQTSSS